MKVVVNGSSSILGCHLCRRLVNDGYDVIELDNSETHIQDQAITLKDSISSGYRQLLRPFQGIETTIDCQKKEPTFLDADVMVDLSNGVYDFSAYDEIEALISHIPTSTAFTLAHVSEIKKFILASSARVYGEHLAQPFTEVDSTSNPICATAAACRTSELLAQGHHASYDYDVTVLRLFSVYGPQVNPNSHIYRITEQIELDKPVHLPGDGNMQRDFVNIRDVVEAFVLAIEKCAGFSVYNIGSGKAISLTDLTTKIEAELGKKAVSCKHVPIRYGDLQLTWADRKLAQENLRWSPKVDLEQGLAEFVQWYRQESKNNR